jgi:hypothetical protein
LGCLIPADDKKSLVKACDEVAALSVEHVDYKTRFGESAVKDTIVDVVRQYTSDKKVRRHSHLAQGVLLGVHTGLAFQMVHQPLNMAC